MLMFFFNIYIFNFKLLWTFLTFFLDYLNFPQFIEIQYAPDTKDENFTKGVCRWIQYRALKESVQYIICIPQIKLNVIQLLVCNTFLNKHVD